MSEVSATSLRIKWEIISPMHDLILILNSAHAANAGFCFQHSPKTPSECGECEGSPVRWERYTAIP